MSETFKYTIMNDPMRISDEEFFGLWDSKKSVWTIAPIFNYEKYSNKLYDVCKYAKMGDYVNAKNSLLEYYRSKNIKIISDFSKFPDGQDKKCFMALERNVYSSNIMNGMVMDIFTVGSNLEWHSVDVMHSISKLNLGNTEFVCYQLVSVDKSDVSAWFYSRKSKYSPYLELVVNNETVKVKCAKDTMLSGGENSSKSFCNSKIFEVRESGTYHNHDENMKRAYFAFALSFLKETDIVTSVSFNIFGKSEGIDKEIVLYNEFEANWKEEPFCWNDVTDELIFSCNDMNSWDFITPSHPSQKGKICLYHRGNEFIPITRLYEKNHDEKYAYTFIRNCMANICYVGCNRDVYNELDMSTHCHYQFENLFRVIDSKYLTGEIFTAILKNMYQLADWLVNNYYGKSNNNWASFATKGVYSVMAFMPELKVRDKWFDITVKENERLIMRFMNPDWSCVELAQWYHNVLIGTITEQFEIYKSTKEPLPFSSNMYDTLHKLMKSFYYTLSPTGSDCNIGDTTCPFIDMRYIIKKWYELCPEIVNNDDELKFAATDGRKGSLPEFTTINFPYNVRTYMRTDWTRNALYMIITGKVNGSHGHHDSFSLVMMAYGRHLLTDQGYGTQLTGNIREKMIASESHNVVLADDTENDMRTDAKQIGFYSDDKYDYCEISGSCNNVVDIQNRSVLFCKKQKFCIVNDYIKPIDMYKTTKYSQYWHMLPNANMTVDNKTKIIRSNFEDRVNVMVVPVGYDDIETAELQDSKYSPGAGTIAASKKACLIKHNKGSGYFTTLIIPTDKYIKFTVKTKKLLEENPEYNAFMAVISDDKDVSNTYCGLHNILNLKKEIKVGRYTTDAINMLVQEDKNGNVVSFNVYGGTFLKKDGKYIFKSEN